MVTADAPHRGGKARAELIAPRDGAGGLARLEAAWIVLMDSSFMRMATTRFFGTALTLLSSGCGGDPDGCETGAPCAPEVVCHLGSIACDTGSPVCVDTGASAPAGEPCGVNGFCTAGGDCGACTVEEACDEGIAACHLGGTSCETGTPVCVAAGLTAEGTACDSGDISGYCAAGVCTACPSVGADCGVGGRCAADGRCMLTVTGVARITYWPEAGEPTDVGNCFGQQAEVFSPDAEGGYELLAPTTGVCTATTGTFTIPEPVPAGRFLLHFAGTSAYGNFYVETTRAALDFGRDQGGRPDSNVVAGASTLVTFASSGLDAWSAGGDQLDFVCGNVGVELAVAGSALGLLDLAEGVSAGSSVVDWRARPLLDPQRGDVAWLYQLAVKPAGIGALRYRTVTRAANLAGLAIDGLAPLSVSAPLQVVSQSASADISWSAGRFESLLVEANPGHAGGAHFLSIGAVLAPEGAGAYAPASARVELLSLTAEPGQGDLALGALAYGRFLGGSWEEVVSVGFETHTEHQALGATRTAASYVGIYQQDPLPLTGEIAIDPRLGPPIRPLVAGLDATVPQSGVGTSAELSWLAPKAGEPDYYAVTIKEVALDGDGLGTNLVTVALLFTPARRIVLPPGVLVAGRSYFAVIAALATPVVPYDQAPLRRGHSTVRAEAGTAAFTP